MNVEDQDVSRPPTFLENSLLVVLALLSNAVLLYQLPRWAKGLDPTFVPQRIVQHTGFPVFWHLMSIHPLIWIAIIVLSFVMICRNYSWKLRW